MFIVTFLLELEVPTAVSRIMTSNYVIYRLISLFIISEFSIN